MKNLLLILFLFLFATTISAKKYKVFYLGGQSNMDGYGYVKELPEKLKGSVNGVYIFHGNTTIDSFNVGGQGVWDVLKPGHGVGHSSTSNKNILSDRFGIELTFATEMQKFFPMRILL